MRINRSLSPCLLVSLSSAVSLSPCLLVFSFAGCAGKTAPEPVYIGHVAPPYGPVREAILLAVEEANAVENQVAGRPVAVLHPEIKDADTDQAAAVRLITIDRAVALLAGTGPAATERLSRTAQQYSLPLLATVSPASGTLPPNGFSVGLSPAARGKALARFLAENLKKPNVTVVKDGRGSVNDGVAAAFAEGYRAAGGKVEKQRDYATDKELTDLLADVKKVQTGAVVFVGAAADFARLVAVKQPDSLPLLFGGEEATPDGLVPDGGSAKAPVYRTTAFAIDPSLPRTKEFADKYQGRFKRSPDAPTALAYDSARILFDAMRRAGGFQGAKVRAELLNTKDFESVTGPLSFDKDHVARRPVFITRVENGKEKLEKRYDPQ